MVTGVNRGKCPKAVTFQGRERYNPSNRESKTIPALEVMFKAKGF